MLMVCENCASPNHATSSCPEKKKDKLFFAPASQLSLIQQGVQDGKYFSVIPTAIDNKAVIRVHPTKGSKYDLVPDAKELQKIKKLLEETQKQVNAATTGTNTNQGGSASKHAELIRGFLK